MVRSVFEDHQTSRFVLTSQVYQIFTHDDGMMTFALEFYMIFCLSRVLLLQVCLLPK